MTHHGQTDASIAPEPCDRVAEVSAYHDHELPPQPAEAMRAHLAECAPCREELARLEALSAWLLGGEAPVASEAFLGQLRGAMRRRRTRLVLRVTEWAAAVAAAVLVAFSAMLWRQGSPRPATPTVPAAWESVAADETPAAVVPAEEEPAVDPDVLIALSILQSGRGRSGNGH